MVSFSSRIALRRLQWLSPKEDWSIEFIGDHSYRLLRRNIPIVDRFFHDLHYCPCEKIVVGILNPDGEKGRVIVDREGKPTTKKNQDVVVSTYIAFSEQLLPWAFMLGLALGLIVMFVKPLVERFEILTWRGRDVRF